MDAATDEAELRGLLVPLPVKELEAYEVSTLVNSPRNDLNPPGFPGESVT
jgi:putative SOS response-associated peptidase YedK